jgi:CRP-like cAMP-binding protein
LLVRTAMSLLARNAQLSAAEQLALESVCGSARRYVARHSLLHTGEAAPGVFVIFRGIACRFSALPGGHAQMHAYLIPGDVCGLRSLVGLTMDHSVRAMTALDVGLIPRESLRALCEDFPGISTAFLRLSQTEAAIARQWLLNVGHRSALSALAHLFCELFLRFQAAGLAENGTCPLPLTQTDLAEALALSPVHLNRTLMKLRRAGIATLRGGKLSILDPEALRAAARFDPSYLSEPRAPLPTLPLETGTSLRPEAFGNHREAARMHR